MSLNELRITTSITRSFRIFMLWQSGWHIYVLTKILLWKWLLASESRIYRFYDKKVVICHSLCHNINMWMLLVILVVINLYSRIHIFKRIKNNIGFIKKKLNSGYFKRQYLNIKLIQVLKNCILNTAIQYLYS